MSDNRWQAHRAGILNYWYYDEAEFYFAGGRLLLRGSNGSGKSVTMQSLVTVLLDGVKRADRLDSFGSKSRTMDDYLLGEKEISSYDERTGYLYLEYKRENSDQYITTGIGLHARRGSSKVDFWGFILQNGRRIGEDFFLYRLTKDPETGAEQKTPLTRRELENAIGQDGRVTTEQREYMAMVNQYVFGYEDIGKYEELMKLLIQLRSPKLSRDFKPSVIYEILNESLPTLSDEDLRPLAETLENMEKTRLAIEQLKREQAAFKDICKAYTGYNAAVLAERALGEAESRKALNRLKAQEEEQRSQLQEAEAAAEKARQKQQELNVEQAALQQEQRDLQEHEAYKAAEKKKEAESQLSKENEEKERREESLARKRRRELDLSELMKKEEQELSQLEGEASQLLEDLQALANEADFGAHRALSQGFKLNNPQLKEHFALWQKERKAHGAHLQELLRDLRQYEEQERRAQQLERELGEETRCLDDFQHEHERLLEELDQAKEQLVKAFYEWKKSEEEAFPIPKEEEIRLTGALRDLYQGTGWLDIQNHLNSLSSAQQRQLDSAIGKVRLNLQELDSKLLQASAELKILKETREAEPELGEAYQKAREQLQKQGLNFLPLYEATEFRPTVTAEMRERLESALLEAGLLNALILEKNETAASLPEEMRGAVIFAGDPVMLAESLLDYLEPVPGESGLSKERIAAILSSIEVNGDLYRTGTAASLNLTQGAYTLGCLSGRAAERERALFIGKQAREAYRRRQIEAKEAEITELSTARDKARIEETALLDKSEKLRHAKDTFPSPAEAQAAFDEARSKEQEIERQKVRLQEKEEAKKKLALELLTERKNILALREETALAFSSAAYEGALQALAEYGEEQHRLTLLQSGHAHTAELFRQHREEHEYAAGEVDTLKGEILDKEFAIGKLTKTIEALSRQLEEMDAAAIEARIAEVVTRLAAIPGEISQVSRELGQRENQRESLTAELERLERRHGLYQLLLSKWQELLRAEEQRGYPGREKKSLTEIMQARRKDRDTTLITLAQRVEKQYANHRDEIAEYRFSLRECPDELGPLPELDPEDEELFLPRWEALQNQAVRQLALTETGGKPISPYEQQAQLTQHLLEQESLLSEQDKKIYQEIIMNSIGRTISDKIYGAEDWIKKMNRLMAASETSSALRFRLEWKPLTGEEDQELDTAELVELLHSDPELMKDEDMKRLEEHFAHRIRRAREAAEAQEKDAEAFQASVREQLDYRRWFRFRLYYDKGEQIKRRELTDKAFFRFSGGEKAMAMYVPLFSAAYSRYMDAGSDAPRLITLDEAFAGVDEQNMRDMFRLVEQMGFNYIMNSQAIWGDYDVVPSLNIYELLRPLNANYVSLLPYHWDGRERSVMVEAGHAE